MACHTGDVGIRSFYTSTIHNIILYYIILYIFRSIDSGRYIIYNMEFASYGIASHKYMTPALMHLQGIRAGVHFLVGKTSEFLMHITHYGNNEEALVVRLVT